MVPLQQIVARTFSAGSYQFLSRRQTWQLQNLWIEAFGAPFILEFGRRARFSCDDDVYGLVELLKSTAGCSVPAAIQIDFLAGQMSQTIYWISEIAQDWSATLTGNDAKSACLKLSVLGCEARQSGPLSCFGAVIWGESANWTAAVLPPKFDLVILCMPDVDLASGLQMPRMC